MKKLILVLAFVLAPAVVRAQGRFDGGQAEHGFVAEARLGSELINLSGGTGSSVTFAGVQGGVFGGYKIRRFIFGLGFDVARVATGTSTGNTSTSSANTSIAFVPGLSVAIVRSADKRVELFGEFDMGFGTTVGDSIAPGESIFRFSYDIGPGVRYWVHPQFAFGALAGLNGVFTWDTRSA